MSLTASTPSEPIPCHALVVGSGSYPLIQTMSSMTLTTHQPSLTKTALDVKFWRERLAKDAGVDALSIATLGADLSLPVPPPVAVSSGEFLEAFQAMVARAAASGARPVLVYSGAGVWDAHRGAGLAFSDCEVVQSKFIGVVWLRDLAAYLDVHLPAQRLFAWLDCAMRAEQDPNSGDYGSSRTITPEADVPAAATRFRSTDAVYPVDARALSDEKEGMGTLTKAWSLLAIDLSEIDPGSLEFRLFDIKTMTDTTLGFMLVVATPTGTIPAPFSADKEFWRFDSNVAPWPDAFKLVPSGNASYPGISSLAGVEVFAQQQFSASATHTLPTSLGSHKLYALSKLTTGGASVVLDAHFQHLVGTVVETKWWAANGALSNLYINLGSTESLVFTRLTTAPSDTSSKHHVSAARL